MRRVLIAVVILALGYQALDRLGPARPQAEAGVASDFAEATSSDSVIADAFRNQRSDVLVQGRGEVVRVLADDNDGSRHQRFILRLDSGQTLLVAHNIDLAPRIAGIASGDRVEFSGEYEWNDQGGVIHWTHRDPRGQHRDGWLRRGGQTYQ